MLHTIEESLDSVQRPEGDKKRLGTLWLRKLKEFGDRVTEFGISFAVCDANGQLLLQCKCNRHTAHNDDDSQCETACDTTTMEQSEIKHYAQYAKECIKTEKQVCRLGEDKQILAAVLEPNSDVTGLVALIDLGTESGESCSGQDDTRSGILGEMLRLLAENFRSTAKAEEQIEIISTELAHVYEELVLLHKISTNMKITEPDTNFLQMACDNLTDIVSVEGIAILLEKVLEGQKQLVLAAGSGLIELNEEMMTVLNDRLANEINSGKDALLDSEVDSSFTYDWSDSIENIIAVPLFGKGKTAANSVEAAHENNHIAGLMVAINRIDKADFDSIDVKLFNSVANECAVFVENGRLFNDLKELFIGSLKALTWSIDAKDQYTRGHSERVAFISKWIGERVAEAGLMEHEQIATVYLAGLLHDIGKMGINENVLRKEGRLTTDEYHHIMSHPSIGASILSGIKQMKDIVPGVLSHHERIDGKGYPNGLSGDQIPMIGKVIKLADSFDAMTSKRTYRDAMPVEQALEEIKKGLGTQFDEESGKIFIDSDIYNLWHILQEELSEVYGEDSFLEYGTIAVGTLIG